MVSHYPPPLLLLPISSPQLFRPSLPILRATDQFIVDPHLAHSWCYPSPWVSTLLLLLKQITSSSIVSLLLLFCFSKPPKKDFQKTISSLSCTLVQSFTSTNTQVPQNKTVSTNHKQIITHRHSVILNFKH